MELALNTSVRISYIKHNQNLSSSSWTEIWRWMGCQTWYFVWGPIIHNMQTRRLITFIFELSKVVCTYHRCPTKGCNQLSRKKHRRCPKCKKQVSLQWEDVKEMAGRFYEGMEAMDTGDVDGAKQTFCSYLDTMYRVGAPPCRDMSLCQDALRICLANSGNTWIIRKWRWRQGKFTNLQVQHQTIQKWFILQRNTYLQHLTKKIIKQAELLVKCNWSY